MTLDRLYYVKSSKEPTIIAYMETIFVRTDFLEVKPFPDSEEVIHCIRFVRNMCYTDIFSIDAGVYDEWRQQLPRVFVQSDFHTKYETKKCIGKGSFARVYLVVSRQTGRNFAVKAFSKDFLLGQPKGRDSVINEIQVMRRLKHPNIINFEELHESKNSIYLVLELLEGGDLLSHLSTDEMITPKGVQRVV